jgi:hypothetical protein
MLLLFGSELTRLPIQEPPSGALYMDGAVALHPMAPLFDDIWYQMIPGDAWHPVHGTVFVQAVTFLFHTQTVALGCPASFTFFGR